MSILPGSDRRWQHRRPPNKRSAETRHAWAAGVTGRGSIAPGQFEPLARHFLHDARPADALRLLDEGADIGPGLHRLVFRGPARSLTARQALDHRLVERIEEQRQGDARAVRSE